MRWKVIMRKVHINRNGFETGDKTALFDLDFSDK